jgi:hypothetical protein
LVQRKWGAGPEGAGWKMLVVPLLSLLVVGDWRWRRLKEKKVRSRRESVGAGILFWQQRGKSGGVRIDLGSVTDFMG